MGTDRSSGTPDPVTAARMVNSLRQRHVLTSASGPRGNVLKVRPPMVFRETDATRFLEVFDEVLAEVTR